MAERPVPEVPRPPTPAAGGGAGGLSERVADADRDRTVTLLREHVVEGRLTLDEFSERMGAALEARTRGELDAVMADLPATELDLLPDRDARHPAQDQPLAHRRHERALHSRPLAHRGQDEGGRRHGRL